MDIGGVHTKTFIHNILKALQIDRWFVLLDLAVLITVMLMVFTEAMILFFHAIFLLLTFGAFYWEFRAFVLRTGFWVSVTSAIILSTALTGELPMEELIEIPMLTAIIALVFVIARRWARAEAAERQHKEALAQANEALEKRVLERTTELTEVNAELMREISQHKQTAETLRESEERYRHLVELGFQAVAIHSHEGFVYVNSAMVELVGADSPEEITGKPLREFVHPDDWSLVQARVKQIGEEGKGVPLTEIRLIQLDGTSVEVELISVPIIYRGQAAVQSVIRDISVRKQADIERARERARIARNLHDSLGHSLAYLHLKLDELSDEAALARVEKVQQNLGQMCHVANQAYEVVRGMLAASLPSNSTDLATALLIQARQVGKRANFEVQITSRGQSRLLPPVIQQQILYISQEALVNVEKHANAQRVEIELMWSKTTLTITVSDDGYGFPPEAPQLEGHFGLAIMQQRAQEIKGQLTLSPSPQGGIQLILRLPLETTEEGDIRAIRSVQL